MKVMRSEPQTIILKEELEVASERYLQTKGSKRKNRNSFIG